MQDNGSKVINRMERVKALVDKLVAQIAENAHKASLHQTTIQILAELEQAPSAQNLDNNVSVILPAVQYQQIPYADSTSSPLPNIQAPIKFEPLQQKEVVDQIAMEPIKDLKSAIGINDKFLFMETLFNKDEKQFETAIKTINGFKNFAEAQLWIQNNLRKEFNWKEEDLNVKTFDQLIKRRFA